MRLHSVRFFSSLLPQFPAHPHWRPGWIGKAVQHRPPVANYLSDFHLESSKACRVSMSEGSLCQDSHVFATELDTSLDKRCRRPYHACEHLSSSWIRKHRRQSLLKWNTTVWTEDTVSNGASSKSPYKTCKAWSILAFKFHSEVKLIWNGEARRTPCGLSASCKLSDFLTSWPFSRSSSVFSWLHAWRFRISKNKGESFLFLRKSRPQRYRKLLFLGSRLDDFFYILLIVFIHQHNPDLCHFPGLHLLRIGHWRFSQQKRFFGSWNCCSEGASICTQERLCPHSPTHLPHFLLVFCDLRVQLSALERQLDELHHWWRECGRGVSRNSKGDRFLRFCWFNDHKDTVQRTPTPGKRKREGPAFLLGQIPHKSDCC